ncbi:hypothetical protein GGH94_004494 [Coemansia aciculifera]|uniref:Uncharacterized protein n=1 Tax=Coemansia aciculifera TaxID=417176 RepID=A0A9W8INC0_9FUNG|nr:hypothetical protein GGH94_004494 [Coemansia aciculifera]
MNAEGNRYTLSFKAQDKDGNRIDDLNDAENIESSIDLVSFRIAIAQLPTQLEGCDHIFKDATYDKYKLFEPTNLVFSFDDKEFTLFDDPKGEDWERAKTVVIWFLISPKVFCKTSIDAMKQAAAEVTAKRESMTTSSRHRCSIM